MANVDYIIRAIDMYDLEFLWTLALEDPEGFIRKISIRQLGRKRIMSLHSLVRGMDRKKLEEHKSFWLLLEKLCLKEVGSGMFTKGNKKHSTTPSKGEGATIKTAPEGGKEPSKQLKEEEQSAELLEAPLESVEPLESNESAELFSDHLEGDKQPSNEQNKSNRGRKRKQPITTDYSEERKQIIDYLNHKTEKNFGYDNKDHIASLNSMLDEGHSVDEFKRIIDNMVPLWIDNKMNVRLNPVTLFRPKHWENYLNSNGAKLSKKPTLPFKASKNAPAKGRYDNLYL